MIYLSDWAKYRSSQYRNRASANSLTLKSRGVSVLPLRFFARGDVRVERGGLLAREGKRFPLVAAEMFCEKNDLAYVVGIVRYLAVDRLHHRMFFRADQNSFREVGVGKRFERGKHAVPSCVPLLHQLGARCRGSFELGVAVAIRLFAVARQKIGPTRPHVS